MLRDAKIRKPLIKINIRTIISCYPIEGLPRFEDFVVDKHNLNSENQQKLHLLHNFPFTWTTFELVTTELEKNRFK
jgi:hypothetical protein